MPAPVVAQVQKDFDSVHAKASAGDVDSIYKLSKLYQKKGDYDSAHQWLERAANKGSAQAQYELYTDLHLKALFPKDPELESKAKAWRDKAQALGYFDSQAKAGNVRAMSELALICKEKGDLSGYKRWLKLAAEKGDLFAPIELANYELEKNPPDSAEALRLYKAEAAKGNVLAYSLIGDMYAQGKGVQQDLTEACVWYEKNAEDVPLVYNTLADKFYYGKEFPQDLKRAFYYQKKCADISGNQYSCYSLSKMLSKGEGCYPDKAESCKYLEKSAQHGFELAQYEIAWEYLKGQGVPQDFLKAYTWFNIASCGHGQLGVEAAKQRDLLLPYLSQAQLEQGQRLAREFKPLPEIKK